MTNKDAASYIRNFCFGAWCDHEWQEAMETAIEALEAQKVNNSNQELNNSTATQSNSINCRDDMISRQAAIDALIKADYEFTGILSEPRARRFEKTINALPSAQPEVAKDTNVLANDAISKQAAVDTVRTMYDRCDTGSIQDCRDMIVEALKVLPSVMPDIIRCEDCKHMQHWYADKGRCFLWSNVGIGVFLDGYCSYAKRRTDE